MPDFPLVPDEEKQVPAPSVSIQQISSFIQLGNFLLSGTIVPTSTSVQITLSLKDQDENPYTETPVVARCWLIDGDRDPENDSIDLLSVTPFPPDTLPNAASFNIGFVDGAASLTLQHEGSLRSWYVAIELNSVVSILGPYILGV